MIVLKYSDGELVAKIPYTDELGRSCLTFHSLRLPGILDPEPALTLLILKEFMEQCKLKQKEKNHKDKVVIVQGKT